MKRRHNYVSVHVLYRDSGIPDNHNRRSVTPIVYYARSKQYGRPFFPGDPTRSTAAFVRLTGFLTKLEYMSNTEYRYCIDGQQSEIQHQKSDTLGYKVVTLTDE